MAVISQWPAHQKALVIGSHGQHHLPRGPRGLDDVMMGLCSLVQGVARADGGPQPPCLHPREQQRSTLSSFLLEPRHNRESGQSHFLFRSLLVCSTHLGNFNGATQQQEFEVKRPVNSPVWRSTGPLRLQYSLWPSGLWGWSLLDLWSPQSARGKYLGVWPLTKVQCVQSLWKPGI